MTKPLFAVYLDQEQVDWLIEKLEDDTEIYEHMTIWDDEKKAEETQMNRGIRITLDHSVPVRMERLHGNRAEKIVLSDIDADSDGSGRKSREFPPSNPDRYD